MEEIDSLFDASRALIGVVSANPSTLTLPEFGSNILSAVCINSEYVCVHTEWVSLPTILFNHVIYSCVRADWVRLSTILSVI